MAINVGDLFATLSLRDNLSRRLTASILNLRRAAAQANLHTSSVASSASRMSRSVAASVTGMAAGVTAGVARMGAQLTLATGKLALLGAAGAAAVNGVVSLGAALAPAVGLLAALPGASALGAAGVLTLSVALIGLKDAFTAALGDDEAKFEEALARLSPAAQAAARELRALRPTLDALRTAVQEALFAPLAGQLSAVAAVLLGPFWFGMSGVADAAGRAAVAVAEFARSSTAVNTLNAVFGALRSIIVDLAPAITPLLTGLTLLVGVGAQFSASLAPGVADAARRLGDFLVAAVASGQALGWMQGALEVLRQLGRIALDVWSIVSGVFAAMRVSGSDALGVLGTLIRSVAEFVNSAQGQASLVAVFSALRTAALALAPVVAAIAVGLGQLAPTLGLLAGIAGPILTGALQALVPALAALSPGLLAVFVAIGQALAVIGPALLPLGQMIAQTFLMATPLIAQLGLALTALLPAITAVLGGVGRVFLALAPALLPLAQAAGGVVVALSPLLPLLGQLAALVATSLAAGVVAVLPSLNLLVEAFGRAVVIVAPVVPLLVAVAARLLGALLPALVPLIPLVAQAASLVGTFLVDALVLLLGAVTPLLPDLSVMAQTFGRDLLVGLRDLAPHLLSIVASFADLLPVIVPVLPPLLQLVTSLLPPLIQLVDAVARLLRGDLVGAIDVAGRAVQGFLIVIGTLGVQLLEGLWRGIQSAAGWFRDAVVGFFRDVAAWARQALGIASPSKVFADIGTQTMLGVRAGMLASSRQVFTTVARIADRLSASFAPDLTARVGSTGQRPVGSGRGGTTVINVTTINPVAEPTSEVVNRGLAYAGMLGVL
ncbi:hypothetical protein ABZ470_39530 [Streptosporangium sp. NPDC020072]|uniref:hypothetical protein n=1 Tax=Streptosporangium sp. NPDC020072 TaxID=3154788 RepID=UPI00344060A4